MGGKENCEDTVEGDCAERMFQHIKAQHDKLLNELQHESTRLEQEWLRETSRSSNSAGPFSAFKKFIDDGLSSISHALQEFPANAAELTSRMQREQDCWRAEEQDISKRWTGSTDSPDHVHMEQSRSTQREQEEAIESAAELLDIAHELNAHIPPSRVKALYRDDSGGPGVLDMIESLSMISPEQPRWLSVDWFKRDPYSPVRLEAHPALGRHGAKWRAAFEDLLKASLDKPVGSIERVGMRVPYGRPQSTYYGPGLDWMLSLQCRGILPSQLPRYYGSSEASDTIRMAVYPSVMLGAKHLLSAKSLASLQPADTVLAADFQDLVSAVGTKATANTEAEPLPVRVDPDTEQDLYQSSYLFPRIDSTEHFRGERADGSTANESPTSRNDRLEAALLRRGVDLAGHEFESFAATKPSFEELVERVLRLQEEHDNLEQLTGQAWNSTTPEPIAEEPRTQDQLWKMFEDNVGEANHRVSRSGMWSDKCSLPPLARRSDQIEKSPNVAPEQTPSVLAALTTTHTTRHPDGTVTIKVVLKQRFSDGREETLESFHTRTEESVTVHDEQRGVKKPPQTKGWFWKDT
ncbi:hypothetical protein Slin15195_G048970 [Septoria linicola]|uniref:Uncharacterized protein n=1 Tax=Septoria linicola TaxID=215465 RepID=A0A9Q9AR24_9PEZI|nr:hypothetical protein Slin15195_G048970 [Septoria linicola]